jgi:hypothetical protein
MRAVWTDSQIAEPLRDGYVGVKLDGTIEKARVKSFDLEAS